VIKMSESTAEVASRLRTIWAELLHQTPDDDDDFFEQGGTSLTMVRLLLAAEDEFGLEMSVEELFAESFTFGGAVRSTVRALEAGADRPRDAADALR
jgi:acyl carrier protein